MFRVFEAVGCGANNTEDDVILETTIFLTLVFTVVDQVLIEIEIDLFFDSAFDMRIAVRVCSVTHCS